MSLVLRAKRRASTPLPATGLWVLIGLAAIFFLVRYGTELLREHELREQARFQSIANTELSEDNARLRSSLIYYDSDHYIEQRAREDLNLRRHDESVLIPVNATSSNPLSPEVAEQAASTTSPDLIMQPGERPAERPRWEAWLTLFTPTR